ncbi:MAG: delta-class carbonic anhydrase [Pseudomonadota bacterium]
MKNMQKLVAMTASLMVTGGAAFAAGEVSDQTVADQRAALAESTAGAGFGPQAPRDIDAIEGTNLRSFEAAPSHTAMNLCNIHFHESAEHRGGEFTTYRGNGDGKGAGTGFVYSGTLSEAELAPLGRKVGEGKYGDLAPGDTIEVHYVHTTAQVTPGPTLGACLSEAIINPQLRVETQVFVLVNDESARDFVELTEHQVVGGLHQAVNIPTDTGVPVQYAGSTTGPSYNEKGSPLQVSWSVRPRVAKVSIQSVEAWLSDNVFEEQWAHGVRNLVKNPDLLAPIEF